MYKRFIYPREPLPDDHPAPPKLGSRQDCCDLTASVPCADCPLPNKRKPDAWQIRDKHGRWITLPGDWQESENIEGREYRPLYALQKNNPCPGCDGHECDNGCAYPGAVTNGERQCP
jgi:hypothetical protein